MPCRRIHAVRAAAGRGRTRLTLYSIRIQYDLGGVPATDRVSHCQPSQWCARRRDQHMIPPTSTFVASLVSRRDPEISFCGDGDGDGGTGKQSAN